MRDVDEDLELLKQMNSRYASRSQPTPGRFLRRPVSQRRPPEVCERHHPHPEPRECSKQLDVAPYRLTALEREHQRDPAVGQRDVDVVTAPAQRHHVSSIGREAMSCLNHPQGLSKRALRAKIIVDEYRQDLHVDATSLQLRQPSLTKIRGLIARRPAAHEHEQIVMGVDDGRRAMQPSRLRMNGHENIVTSVPNRKLVPANSPVRCSCRLALVGQGCQTGDSSSPWSLLRRLFSRPSVSL